MAESKISRNLHVKVISISVPISAAEAGMFLIQLPATATDLTPTGYRFVCASAYGGSDVTIRNNVAFVGLTANTSYAWFYTNTAVSGSVTLYCWYESNYELSIYTPPSS